MVSSPKTTRRLLTLWLTLLGASGCTDSDATAGPPRGPTDFRISQVSGVTTGVTSSDEALTVACDEPLLVWIDPASDGKLGDFTLQPPGKCGDETNCGWIELQLSSANTYAEVVKIASSHTPVRVDLPTKFSNESVLFHAELRDAKGAVVMTDANLPLAAELVVNVVRNPCVAPSAM